MLQVNEDLRGFFTACRIIKTSIRIPHITHIASFKVNKTSQHWNFPDVLGFYWLPPVYAAILRICSAGAPRFTSVQIVDSSRKSRSSWSASCEKKSSITTTRCLRFGLITRWEVWGKSLVQSVCLTIPHAIVEERIELPISSLFHCVFCHFNSFHISHTTCHTWAGCKPLLPELCLYCIEVDLRIDDICLHRSTRVEMQKPEQEELHESAW